MRRLAIVVITAAVMLTACGGDSSPQAERSNNEKQHPRGGSSKTKNARGEHGGKNGGATTGNSDGGGAGGSGDGGGSGRGGSGGTAAADDRLATASSRVEEPEPDAQKQGLVPDYAEALAVSVVGLGEQDFRVTITFNGALPSKMPDDKTIMIVSFGLKKNDKDKGYAFTAQCRDDGWHVYAGGKEDTAKYPGEFATDGTEMVMTIPWSYIKGPYEFDWFASSSWFQQLANTASYSFDPIPNDSSAHYPN